MSARRGRLAGSAVLLGLTGVLLMAAPAAAATNPVLDPEADADLAETLAEATEVQGVCYGYGLRVSDADTRAFSGTFASSSTGAGRPAVAGPTCPRGVVQLVASISYASSYSDAEDSASWFLQSTLPGLTILDVERVTGSGANGLLDDAKSEDVLVNAVLALPGLATERAGVPPLVLDPMGEPAPDDARATGTPGSDWTRENGPALTACVLALVGAVVALALSRRRPADGAAPASSDGTSEWPRPGGDPRAQWPQAAPDYGPPDYGPPGSGPPGYGPPGSGPPGPTTTHPGSPR